MVFHKQIIFLLSVVIFFSCTVDKYELPTGDSTPPQAIIIYPIDGETVQNIEIIQARATDNEAVDSVQFFINQTHVGTDIDVSDDIFEYEWRTMDYEEDEYHAISVIAFDKAENDYATFPIRSKVDNSDGESPTAFIINPFTGQFVSGIVPITVEASDNDSIQYVSFYVNNILQGYVQEPPYIFQWNTHLLQDDLYYSIYVVVRDMSNNVTTVAPVSVIVDNNTPEDTVPPTGSITSPPAGMVLSGDVEIMVSATDNRAMGEVQISIDGNLIFTDEEAPYQYTWDTTQEEDDVEHTISILLVDLSGNQMPLNPVSVIVDNDPTSDLSPPVLVILDPASGQQVSGTVSININATDDTGIGYIEFFIDGEFVYYDDSYPYVFDWNTESYQDDVNHIISVIGYDIEDNIGYGSPISVYVDNFDNIPPTGHIQYPAPGQTVSGTIDIVVAAMDNVGISQVDLWINDSPVDTLTNSPFTYSWDTTQELEDQAQVISAAIYDSSYNVYYTPTITVYTNNIINDIIPPTGTITNPMGGQIVTGIIPFTVSANDNDSVGQVEFIIDGDVVSIDSDEPYQFDWDTNELANGSQHTLTAIVYDASGNFITLQPILVTISNE